MYFFKRQKSKKSHFSPDYPVYSESVLYKLNQTVLEFADFYFYGLRVFHRKMYKHFLQCTGTPSVKIKQKPATAWCHLSQLSS